MCVGVKLKVKKWGEKLKKVLKKFRKKNVRLCARVYDGSDVM